jgi:chromosome segregation protein
MAAIVGPNGSGKSNVADAIRWVLGEQRYSTLRGKKTEDVIFAGSSLKPAMGYAEASITFDNTDRILPLDFQEVTITRRAYRTGENEYFINKSRVRLKDIHEAVTALSQTYTVITQGMVDAALSQKPDERRGLFEDAAAISLYNLKKAEAEDKLGKTEQNSKRVSDLVAEIKPRLKGLEQHARQAEEFYGLQEEQQRLLKKWYAQRWRSIQASLLVASQLEQEATTALYTGKVSMEALQTEINQVRQNQTNIRTRLVEQHHISSELHTRAQQLQQQVAVDQERLNGLVRQRENLQPEFLNIGLAIESSTKHLAELEQEYTNIQAGQAEEHSQLGQQEAVLQEKTQAVQQATEALNRQRGAILQLSAQLDTLKARLSQLQERRAQLVAEEEKYLQRQQQTAAEKTALASEQAKSAETAAQLENDGQQLAAKRKTAETELNLALEKSRRHERSVAELRGKREAARSRLDLLNRLQASFTGYYGGVKVVMQAAQAPNNNKARLTGILGLVANLLQVPAELETAIETALGGHLQDVVVASFRDAEKAIELLKAQGAGRATFLPLDSLKNFAASNPGRNILNISGVQGVAADLVQYQAQYNIVYEQLLGRVLVVDDLQVARQTLPDLPNGWTVVTLAGEIVRSSGSVTGGANGKDKDQSSGMLMRERELRELPQEILRLEQAIQNKATALTTEQANVATLRQNLAGFEREAQQLNRNQQQVREKLAQLNAQATRISDEMRLREETHQNVIREQAELKLRETELNAETHTSLTKREQLQTQMSDFERDLRGAQATEHDEREQLAALKTAQALSEQRLRNAETNLKNARRELAQRQDQLSQRQSQLSNLENQENALHGVLETAQTELAQLSSQLETLRGEIAPLEASLKNLEQHYLVQEKQWNELGTNILNLEAAHGRAALETQRVQTEIETLQLRAADDLAPSLTAISGQPQSVDLTQWYDEAEPELNTTEVTALNTRIEQLRTKLRRIGAVNPLAVQEFRETTARYDFLATQLADLEQTGQALRVLIKELDTIMQEKFAQTFGQVAEHFSKYFGLLFNGGTAKLTLTEPDNVANTGIEILAQPPGKRQQNLNLLSGGERALTAVALLFALLEVNPTPFCVMDEVDAALDEANVGRFCQTLKMLADRTQFIVITHNRATIEAARTLYGISMGADSISKVISLKIEEALTFKENGKQPKTAARLTTNVKNEEQAEAVR